MRVLTFQVCVYTSNPSDIGYDDSTVVAAILIIVGLKVLGIKCVSAEDISTVDLERVCMWLQIIILGGPWQWTHDTFKITTYGLHISSKFIFLNKKLYLRNILSAVP